MAPNGHTNGVSGNLTNYVAYLDPKASHQSRIGHLDVETSSIQPLSFASGTPLTSLYQVIEIGEANIKPSGEIIQLSSVQLQAPICGRDVLAVGKNYFEHAIEFNTSGYDSSDKTDQPTHPVIFTKRATSIIAHGEPIFPHPGFTDTVDYEGEIGVIIGKSGFKIEEKDALNYVWGYTIINDMTARERQRDHKQFYIGKSPDTFCPMGPIAVPASKLPKILRVQTRVNGEKRQDSTTDELIFSIPFLVKTLSAGQTLQPGDVLATGTPAGVGFGQKPPVFLKPGDVIEVSVTGLGSLKNTIADPTAVNQTVSRVQKETHVPISNLSKSCGGVGLASINSKQLYYRHAGVPDGSPIIFIHGLGGTSEFYTPLIASLGLERNHSLHLLDLEGHGLSPTSAISSISISSYASDFYALAQEAKVSGATVVAHSMGCLVAITLALQHPEIVSKLLLLGPPPTPLPEAGQAGSIARAAAVRKSGMAAVVDTVVTAGTSAKSKDDKIGIAAVRLSLLSQDPEGYAKGCTALAGASEALPVAKIKAKTLIVTGDEDKVSPPQVCEKYSTEIKGSKVHVLSQVGHWHIFEDVKGVSDVVASFFQ
ncbi:fumarylacetoacetate hydrolase-like protein [Hyaloscypha variabilis F]|uniref:Fumarylacetoacetate hydrolase-like protein n=1 Tax=Hyaloscypha variabilis (strain UAMH 11265 / GT02V1 / F) TaxID=1149755 RepID=A0A2J6QUF1_HYAVF|nr:fumarylacetoacetate hydrolase-like protein [Hyaloscypha variabilis F]